jgi:hypothetical protein
MGANIRIRIRFDQFGQYGLVIQLVDGRVANFRIVMLPSRAIK